MLITAAWSPTEGAGSIFAPVAPFLPSLDEEGAGFKRNSLIGTTNRSIEIPPAVNYL